MNYIKLTSHLNLMPHHSIPLITLSLIGVSTTSDEALSLVVVNNFSEQTMANKADSETILVFKQQNQPPQVKHLNAEGKEAWKQINATILHELCTWYNFEELFQSN